MPGFLDYVRPRLPLLGVTFLTGTLLSLSSASPATQDEAGLRGALSGLLGSPVEDVHWEPSRGAWFDFLLGRPLLVQARDRGSAPSSPRDIYRVVVRLSPGGKMLSFGAPHNLTQTSQSDEHDLAAHPAFLAWVAEAPDSPPSISILSTKPRAGWPRGTGVLDRLQLGFTRYLETGTWSGADRLDVIAADHRAGLQLTATSEELRVTTHLSHGTFTQALRVQDWGNSPELVGAPQGVPHTELTRFETQERRALPWGHFLANTLRHFAGTTAVARLESAVFRLRDVALRVGYGLTHPLEEPAQTRPARPVVSETDGSSRRSQWPPADLPASAPGDGEWSAWSSSLLPPSEQPLFYKTVLHNDPERPYAELHLVAFDVRRLELGMRAGYEDPKPETGPPGSGHIPPELAPRIVATFNGAFKSTHGRYGMKAEERLLIAPVVGTATVRVDPGGKIGLGTWQETDDAAGAFALRQNMDALVEGGQPNPKGRTTWGEHVDATGVAIERSALCLHDSGNLIYAWATEATGATLAQGLADAGCNYAVHLDMNPGHCTFALNRVTSFDPLVADGQLLDRRMKVNATRYIRWSPKDFFYLALRDPSRPPLTSRGQTTFDVDRGTQPTPTFIPGIFRTQVVLGPLTLDITRVDPGRTTLQVAAGGAEGLSANAPLPELSLQDYSTALLALGLGHHTHGTRPGLSIDRRVIVPLSRGYATLVLRSGGPADLLPPGEPLTEQPGLTLVQLPALARDGTMLDAAKELGGKRSRQALCIDESGTLYFGALEHDSIAPLVQSLLELGCTLVAEADRGSHSPTHRARAGDGDPPRLGHAQTVLYALDQQMIPQTYTF